MKALREKLNEVLDGMAYELPSSTASGWIWGEVEVPECLRKELEEVEEQE